LSKKLFGNVGVVRKSGEECNGENEKTKGRHYAGISTHYAGNCGGSEKIL
jgi:hypothetical protein